MYEIELKSLLGSKEKADELKRRLRKLFPQLVALPHHKQLNHYFKLTSHAFSEKRVIATTANVAHTNDEKKEFGAVLKAITPLLSEAKQVELSRILQNVEGDVSIRTREADGKVLFILKASIGDDTSANGVSRIEFECVIAPIEDGRDCGATNAAHANKEAAQRPRTLEGLDKILLDAGLSYQAKWSREREEYHDKHIHVTIDKNAGYGYLAEFEQILEDKEKSVEAKKELLELMDKLGVAELPQDRLERMFSHYNKHWEEYYGTDKVFVIE